MVILRAINITKRFPGVTALDAVNLDLREGEIHGLVGENGAGKSTFVKILTGVLKPTSGKLFFRQQDVTGWSIFEAYKHVGAVYQEREIVPFFTGLENLFLGIEVGRFLLNTQKMCIIASQLIEEYGINAPLTVPVTELSPGHVTLIAVLKTLLRNPKIVIFDEPTASLSYAEKEPFLSLVRKLADKGLGVLYISHDISEVLSICDVISVLRNGKKVATLKATETTEKEVIELMIDKSVSEQYPKTVTEIGEPLIEVENVSFTKLGIKNVSFSIRKGEIVGFAGLVGSGRTELARAIYTGMKPNSGNILFLGQKYNIRSTTDAIKKGIIMVPENRRTEGLILHETVQNNLVLPIIDFFAPFGLVQDGKLRDLAKRVVAKLDIKITSLSQPVRTLSGGNQQKVSIGKWLNTAAKLWIFDEPTQGIDVDTKRE
ncbi:MAG: sugar ABC transporter ATP-binding protein, partial [Nitrososphaeria archaeon]